MEKEFISYAKKELGYERFCLVFRKKNNNDFSPESAGIIAERYNKKIWNTSRLCLGISGLGMLMLFASVPVMNYDTQLAEVMFWISIAITGVMLMLTGMISKRLKEFAWVDVDSTIEEVNTDKVNKVIHEVNDYYEKKSNMPKTFEIFIVSEGEIDANSLNLAMQNKIRFFEKNKTLNRIQEVNRLTCE